VQRDVKGIIVLIQDTDLTMVVMDLTTVVIVGMDRITVVTQAPSRSRLAIGRTTLAALAIMWAVRITSGSRDIGRAMATFGSMATTF